MAAEKILDMNDFESKRGGHGAPWFAWLVAAIALALFIAGIESLVKSTSAWISALLLTAGLVLVVLAVRVGGKRR